VIKSPEFSLEIALIYLFLFVFGWGYNAVVAWAERKGYAEGYMSLIVSLGVAVTIIPLVIIDWQFSFLMLGAFMCSGMPMILGSIYRHVTARRQEQELERQAARMAEQGKDGA
jgi:hypothetical protein